MKSLFLLLSIILCPIFFKIYSDSSKSKWVIVWQPSHQTDTGIEFSEAETCNGIIESAMQTEPKLKEYKVWSLGQPNLHHDHTGSNTVIAHTTGVIDGKISGYAYELKASNKKKPDVFIAIHNNGGTKSHAIWGYVHEGDQYEAENKILASRLIAAVSTSTNLQNRGVLLDSSAGRNDYVCRHTGKQSFYSLDENVNTARYRVLLEIGDNDMSKAFLQHPENQKKIGIAIKMELIKWLEDKNK